MNSIDNGTNTDSWNQTNTSTQFPEAKHDTSTQTAKNSWSTPIHYNLLKFEIFLSNVSSIIMNELENDNISNVFSIWNGYVEESQYETTVGVSKLYEFESSCIQTFDKSTIENYHVITQVDWNSTVSILAVVHGNRDDTGLSKYPGLIELWKIIMDEETPPEKSLSRLEYESGLNCVAAHPILPDIFAAGAQSGEIVIFHLTDSNILKEIHSSDIGPYFHDAPVLHLEWHYDDDKENCWILYSTGLDGKLLLWKMENNLSYPINGYYIKPIPTKERRESALDKHCFVGNTFSVFENYHSNLTALSVGCDCGQLLLSDLSADNDNLQHFDSTSFSMQWTFSAREILHRVKSNQKENIIKKAEYYAKSKKKKMVNRQTLYVIGVSSDIIYKGLQYFLTCSHWGNIHSIDYCQGYLLSCGDDGVIEVYSIDEHCSSSNVHTIETHPPQKVVAVFYSVNVRSNHCELKEYQKQATADQFLSLYLLFQDCHNRVL